MYEKKPNCASTIFKSFHQSFFGKIGKKRLEIFFEYASLRHTSHFAKKRQYTKKTDSKISF